MPTILEQKLSDCVKDKEEATIVNWQEIAKIKRKCFLEGDGSRSFNPAFETLIELLMQKGILTYSFRDSWTLTDGIADLSPKKPAPHSALYFVRNEDAEEYSRIFYRHNAKPVKITRASETI